MKIYRWLVLFVKILGLVKIQWDFPSKSGFIEISNSVNGTFWIMVRILFFPSLTSLMRFGSPKYFFNPTGLTRNLLTSSLFIQKTSSVSMNSISFSNSIWLTVKGIFWISLIRTNEESRKKIQYESSIYLSLESSNYNYSDCRNSNIHSQVQQDYSNSNS